MAERFAVGVVLCEDLKVGGLAKRWRELRGNRIYLATGAKDNFVAERWFTFDWKSTKWNNAEELASHYHFSLILSR